MREPSNTPEEVNRPSNVSLKKTGTITYPQNPAAGLAEKFLQHCGRTSSPSPRKETTVFADRSSAPRARESDTPGLIFGSCARLSYPRPYGSPTFAPSLRIDANATASRDEIPLRNAAPPHLWPRPTSRAPIPHDHPRAIRDRGISHVATPSSWSRGRLPEWRTLGT